MSIEIRPVGVTCNLRCDYCYETPQRNETPHVRYQRDKVLAAIEKLDHPYSLFGGEPLLIRLPDLEELLKISYERFGYSAIQTNGNLITDKHIALFEQYKTCIGISIDGPGELNDIRWAGTLEATRKHTERTMWAIRTLCEKAQTVPHLRPAIITTLHAGNCAKDKFPQLVAWFRELDQIGIRHVNLHVMELDYKAQKWMLPEDEYGDRLIDLWNLQEELPNLTFLKFKEIMQLLQGNSKEAVCVWHACDPWNTDAVQGIEHDGSPSHCSRTNKDGKNWLPAEGDGIKGPHTTFIGHPGARHYERQLALYVTPQDVGGCKDCEFWLICQGQCPGTGSNNDWRMRSSYCGIFKRLFREGEKRLRAVGITPISKWPDRKAIEELMYQRWALSQPAYLESCIRDARAAEVVASNNLQSGYHYDGYYEHWDLPHGDHQDAALANETVNE